MSLPRIAVDAMGGDEGVRVMVEGAALARRRHDRFKFLLVGDEARIKAALDNHRSKQLGGAPVPLHRQLIRFDTERQRVTPARSQQVDG